MTRADDLRALRDRWADVPDDVERLTAGLTAGTVGDGPFGLVDGRTDLRGLPVTPTVRGGAPRGRGAHVQPVAGVDPVWSGLDLTGADLAETSWTRLTVRDCVLDDADLGALRCWGVTVQDASLRRADLRHGQLGAGPASVPDASAWRGVDLRGADLRGAHAYVRFEDVDFRQARFGGTDWGWSDLVRCTFAGVVHALTIGGTDPAARPASWTLTGVDLTAARPRDVRLVGVDLGADGVDVRLPEDDDHWHVPDLAAFHARLAAAVEDLTGDARIDAEVWLEASRRRTGPAQVRGFVARWDLDALGGAALVETVRRCLDDTGRPPPR